MARARRACALAAIAGGLAAWCQPPCGVLFWDPEVEGGGAARTARKVRSLRAVARFLSQHPAEAVGHSYDTNAMGESWGRSAMGHWVNQAGAKSSSAELLENELMSMKIGRKAAKHPQRMAMHAKRMMRERELENRHSRPENAMMHWADRPAAVETPELLEEELTSMKIGGISGNEGPRRAMRLRRLARDKKAHMAAQKARLQPQVPRGLTLASSSYDSNAIGESFQASMGETVQDRAQHLEENLRSMQIGRRGSSAAQQHREAMRQRRQAA